MINYTQKCCKSYVNNREHKERIPNRFHASEIASIIDFNLTPEDWLNPPKKTLTSSGHISWGETAEDMVGRWYKSGPDKFKEQIKKEYKFDDITIACVCDFEFEDKVIEVKCPQYIPDTIKPWHLYQLEIQARLFDKPIYIKYINRDTTKTFLYKPSDSRLELIKEKLTKFNKLIHEKNIL